MNMKCAGLFSGFGGWSLACAWQKIPSVFEVEIEEYPCKVLRKNFPGSNVLNIDVNDFITDEYRNKINILSGSFPCQDISLAKQGVYVGLAGDKSGLFYQLIRVANEIKPDWVVWENNPPIMKEIDIIENEFRKIGYAHTAHKFSNRALGFPHLRYRIYGIAASNTDGFGMDKIEVFNKEYEKIRRDTVVSKRQKNENKFKRSFSLLLRGTRNGYFLRASDGIPDKFYKERIKGIGNSVNPEVAEMFIKAAVQTEKYFRG